MAEQTMQIDTPAGIQAYLQGHGGIHGIHVIRNSKGDYQMSVVSEGRIKSGANEGEERPIELDSEGGLLVTQGMPAGVEMSRLGSAWSAITTAPIAALVARPSTVALFTLWNGEAAGGKSYVIDRLFALALVSGTAESRFGIWATIHPPGMTNPGIDIARSAVNLTGNTGKTYNGQGVVGIGETVIDNGWYPWGSSVSTEPTGTLMGGQITTEVAGRLIVPPSGGISLHVIASTTNEDFTIGASWYEVQLDLR